MSRGKVELCPRGERFTLFFVIPGHREAMSPESITQAITALMLSISESANSRLWVWIL
jgi:hypothetical protein